jgi:hypothetical protein
MVNYHKEGKKQNSRFGFIIHLKGIDRRRKETFSSASCSGDTGEIYFSGTQTIASQRSSQITLFVLDRYQKATKSRMSNWICLKHNKLITLFLPNILGGYFTAKVAI